jgi:hypothetical protein
MQRHHCSRAIIVIISAIIVIIVSRLCVPVGPAAIGRWSGRSMLAAIQVRLNRYGTEPGPIALRLGPDSA